MLLKFTYHAQEQELLSDYYAILHGNSLHVADNFIKTVLLECINEGIKIYHYALSYNDCSIRVYRLFTTIFHKCLILILLIFSLHFPIMLLLCLMLSMTHYAQNYAGIIGGSLAVILFKTENY